MDEEKKEVVATSRDEKQEIVVKPIIEKQEKITFLETLSKLSPGKDLRTGLDDILNANDGALIVIDTADNLKEMFDGGFRVNSVGIDRPIQTPTWRTLVGHYYIYPTPWCVDWKNKLIRLGLYYLALILYYLSGGKLTSFASNIVIFAQKKHRENIT